jgi:hypothetical protein
MRLIRGCGARCRDFAHRRAAAAAGGLVGRAETLQDFAFFGGFALLELLRAIA